MDIVLISVYPLLNKAIGITCLYPYTRALHHVSGQHYLYQLIKSTFQKMNYPRYSKDERYSIYVQFPNTHKNIVYHSHREMKYVKYDHSFENLTKKEVLYTFSCGEPLETDTDDDESEEEQKEKKGETEKKVHFAE